jgi:hypothetical protein
LGRAGEATTGEEVGGDAREGEGTGDAGKEEARKKRGDAGTVEGG